ncbi:MAG TPA: PAS domain-containing protein [Allosphingosinicella sp.]|jgi:PAS domain S-box-containing protein
MSGQRPLEDDGFEQFADDAPIMLWRINSSFDRDWANKAWFDFTGGSLAEEASFAWLDRVHPHDSDRVIEQFGRAFEERQAVSVEFRIRAHDGKFRWIVDRGEPFFREGHFAGFVGACIDITERKEAELRSVAPEGEFRKLSQAHVASVGIGEIGQELGETLRAIESMAAGLDRSMRGRADVPASWLDRVISIRDSVERADFFLATSTPDARPEPLQKKPEDLAEVLRSAGDLIKHHLAAAGATLEWDLTPELQARIGRGPIMQVTVTLLKHALDAIADFNNPALRISAARWGRMAVVSVAASGVALARPSEGEVPCSGVLAEQEGCGVGLYAAGLIVSDHGGRFWVDDTREGGPVLRFSIPLSHE